MRDAFRGGWPLRRFPNTPFDINRRSPQSIGLVGWWTAAGTQRGGIETLEHVSGMHGAFNGGTVHAIDDFGPVVDMTVGGSYLSAESSEIRCEPGTNMTWVGWWNIQGDGTRGLFTKGNNGASNLIVQVRATGEIRVLIQFVDSFDSTGTPTGLTHIAVRKKGTDYDLYINGLQDGSKGMFALADTSALPFYIGTDTVNTCDSSCYEARVYNRALSPAEIWHQYAPSTRYELYSPDVRLWPFDEGICVVTETITVTETVTAMAS